MKNTIKNDKWLITVDLDGTFLKSPEHRESAHDSNSDIHPKNLEVVKKLLDLGHKVAIVTGRPWKDTKDAYEKIGLNTIIANYNGAHIHHPGHDDEFTPLTFSINKDILNDVFHEPILMEATKSILVESLTTTYSTNGSDDLAKFTSETDGRKLEFWNIDEPIKEVPMASLLEIDLTKTEDPYRILQVLNRKYGVALFFRFWNFETVDKPVLLLEINQKSSNKGTAMKQIAQYYNIPLSNTISFGDGLNDREMLLDAAVGVVMKNAKGTVKTYGNDITDYTNNEGGVGMYLEDFFELK